VGLERHLVLMERRVPKAEIVCFPHLLQLVAGLVLAVLAALVLEPDEVLEILLVLELLGKEIMEVLVLATITLEVVVAVLEQLVVMDQEVRGAMAALDRLHPFLELL
jgi:hypothetical protein